MSADGIINLYKPLGITSAKALYRLRKITGVRKSGHAGSLDPAAEGVLVICQGKATKLVEGVMDLPKVYRATARLDVTSESFDSDRPLEGVAVARVPSADEIRAALTRFEGEFHQVPPQVSAVKVGGVPAYKSAGRSDAPPLRPRPVRIYWVHLHAYDWPIVDFEMACGRGTYVRALIRDLGLRLRTGGCVTGLIRKAVGPLLARDAWTFERLADVDDCRRCLIGLEEARRMIRHQPVAIPPRPQTDRPERT